MRYAQIRKYDVANGLGIRTSLFVTGCTHNCKGCFNKVYQDFAYGDEWTDKETRLLIEYLKSPEVSGLTLLGGEPFQNAIYLTKVLREVKKEVDKNVWVYSGYTYEEILKDDDKLALLNECHVLVDGLFIEDLKDLKLRFRGSSNQRIIDIEKSRLEGKVVLLDF